MGMCEGIVISSRAGSAVLVKTEERGNGVTTSLKTFDRNPVKEKKALIKPNSNTADVTPGSTQHDTMVFPVEEIWGIELVPAN